MAREKFPTDEFLLDQIDRTQEHRSRLRREGRFHRHRVYLLVSIVLLAMLLLGAPSLVSHSPLGRSLFSRAAAQQGVSLDVESIRVGWITPLRLTGIQIHSMTDGNHFRIEQVDSEMTVVDLMRDIGSAFGEIAVRGVDIRCTINNRQSSLEEDLRSLLSPSESSEIGQSGRVSVQDITVAVTDVQTGNTWQVAQSSGEIDLQSDAIDATFIGVLSEPSGNAGSVQGRFSIKQNEPEQWQLQIDSETLPLSVASLVRRRFPDSASAIPLDVSGNTTGSVRLTGFGDGTVTAALDRLNIRHLQAADPATGDRAWSNQEAKINGELTLTSDRVIGRNLQASTDFASAQLDGSFARSMTLIGVNDNPLRWLDAIDGSASFRVDLAAFDEALPGILPLRKQTRIVSGFVSASINSIPTGAQRRSQLTLRTDPFRASADGQLVVIQPVELTAVVSRTNGNLKAEQFELKSTFASVVGQGDLRSGAADLEIDFARLASTLQPIVKISDAELDGLARGDIRWNATGQNLWRMTGSGSASNVQITLPGGKTIRQANMRGDINATGRWGQESLDELTEATVKLVSSGLDIKAELTKPVRDPSPESAIPIRIESQGRLESLADVVSPWLPAELHDADGGFNANVRGDISLVDVRLTSAVIELDQPRVAYGTRWFAQPNIKGHFDGSFAWPSGELDAKSMTLAGDAVSAGVRGRLSSDVTDLEIAWCAKLDRIQGSVRTRIAGRSANSTRPTAQQVSYRSGNNVHSDDWLVRGDFEGKLLINRNGEMIQLESHLIGKDVAVIQPPQASAEGQTVGPMPRQLTTTNVNVPGLGPPARVVWAEPNLKVDGVLKYDRASGQVDADAMQIAGDWFAMTLTGDAMIQPTFRAAKLNGPAKIKMDQVAQRLSQLTGTLIQAEGLQQTPLAIEVLRSDAGDFSFTVDGQLGWETGEVAGVRFGESTLPFRLTETSVSVSPSVIPVGQGQLNIAGNVFYRPGPLWFQLQPGVVAKSVRLTPEMTDRWLKYLAPLAANAAKIDGTLNAEIDEAMIVIDDPQSSRASGRLNIEGVQMTAGPLTQQIINGIDQLKALSQVLPGQPPASNADANSTKLITMPPQSVEFLLDRGVVSHKTILFEIDRARLITSGQVGLDGRLSLVAQIPLDRRWLGTDLQGLAGQGVSLPITGTLSSPRLDSSGVRQVVSQLTTQTIQSVGDTFLKKQIERSEDYIGDQIGRGLDKLFGR